MSEEIFTIRQYAVDINKKAKKRLKDQKKAKKEDGML